MTEAETLADLARTPAERAASAVPWAGAAVWGAAEIMHWAAWPGMTPEAALGAVAAFSIAFGVSARKGWGWKAPVIVAAFAAWLAFASARGPLDGFHVPPLTVVWAVLTAVAWKLALGHPAIGEARRWREKRAGFLADRHAWRLPGAHLLEHEETRAGERFTVDVAGTGKLASAVARDAALPERIAMHRGIPRSRVTVTEGSPAGRVLIEIRDRDPWADPIPHPAVAAGHEIELDPSPSITGPAGIGQDPATGRVLAVRLCVPGGGLNVNIVATVDSGKTVLLSCISEFVTRAPDALMIRVNLSDKGEAERRLWAPACHLTALGPDQKARALKVLTAVRGIMRWRAQQPKTRANWLPSRENPHVVLIIDELDALTEVPVLRKALEPIATKGREYGITVVRASQRGTAEDTGGAKVRAVDGLWCLGSLTRSTEAMHAAGELGLRLPDVSSYGGGNPGVWIIADRSGKWHGGRAWNLCEPADIAGIARARARSQPDLPEACKAFLGDEYAALVGSDVYARLARDVGDLPAAPSPGGRSQAVPEGPGSPLAALAQLARDGEVEAGGETADALAQGLGIAGRDYLNQIEREMDMPDDLMARWREVGGKLGRARESLAKIEGGPPLPEVPEEKLQASSEARWGMLAEETVIPPEARPRLLELLSGDGMSGRKITETLAAENPAGPPKRAWVMAWLNRLRWEQAAYVDGKGAAAKWRLTAERGDGS